MDIDEDNIQDRNYHSDLGILTRSDGSALLSQGGTIMMAAIFGPLEAKPQRMLIDKSSVEAHYRPKVGLPGVSDRLRESIIRNTCEIALMAALYPRTSIVVVIQEVQNCGELIGCAINAACLALLDSGIEMKFLVGAVTSILNDEGHLIVNPSHLILEKAHTSFTFVFDSIDQNVVASHTKGTFTEEQYKEAVEKCREASEALFSYYRKIIALRVDKNQHKIDSST